jgi:hypothetical protein
VANRNPVRARLGKKLRGRPGTLIELQRICWQSVKRAQYVLEEAKTQADTLRAVHAITHASTAYAKLLEIGELEARLAALEAAQPSPGRGVP